MRSYKDFVKVFPGRPTSALVSLVSVKSRNLTQMVEIIETIEIVENVEIANVHAAFMHVAENTTRYQMWLSEYPTLSAIRSFSSSIPTTLPIILLFRMFSASHGHFSFWFWKLTCITPSCESGQRGGLLGSASSRKFPLRFTDVMQVTLRGDACHGRLVQLAATCELS